MWAASQVHLHRPRSASKQQSRSVMTGCCCQRTVHTHTNPHMAAQSVITQEDICTHRQTRSFPSKQGLSLLTRSLLPPVSLRQTFSHLFAGQNSSCAVTQPAPNLSANPLTSATMASPKVKQNFPTNKNANQTSLFFSVI